MGHYSRLLLVYFHSFQVIFIEKILDFSAIRTRVVGIEGEYADHLTTARLPDKIPIQQMVRFLNFFKCFSLKMS